MKTILLSDIDKKGCPKTIRTMGDLVRAIIITTLFCLLLIYIGSGKFQVHHKIN